MQSRPEFLYFLPIGGTAMAPLAGLLQELGHRVEGVDAHLYPPMSTLLEDLGIPVRLGFDATRLPDDVDRVIIGNAVPRSNVEVEAVLARRLPHLAQAEAVAHYVLARGLQSLVVAGTHGKTTTSAMLSWILETTGADPSYLVGGLPQWNPRGFRLGNGQFLVIEGDEYNTAFFDRGPKFLHYRPHLFILGPVEFDHADLYPNLDAVLTAFRAGAAQVPRDGAVVVNAWSEGALAACRDATAPIVTVGEAATDDLRLISWDGGGSISQAKVSWRGRGLTLQLRQSGLHNTQNAAVAVAAAAAAGVDPDAAAEAMASFPGVARRMEIVGDIAGIVVVDDFAHHPTALAATIAAARQSWPGRRLVIAFEPRSLTAARQSFHDAYLTALSGADLALVASPYHSDRLTAEEILDRTALAEALAARGVASLMPDSEDDPVESLLPSLHHGDVVVGCSSGDFGGFHHKLVEALQTGGA
ncbi:MAG: Mur ligase domain-containing protein [Acidobacteriota bacterium]|nr:Mur ligase domain-containing protein [Acidobacteriota bacterium]